MQRLGAEFIKEMGLEGESKTIRSMACEMLCLVVKHGAATQEIWETCFTDDILEDKALVEVLDLAGYWSTDLAFILQNQLTAAGHGDNPLCNKSEPYQAVWDFCKSHGIEVS